MIVAFYPSSIITRSPRNAVVRREKRERAVIEHRFKVFIAVAQNLSVTRAARQLRISQPAVTQALRRLEKDFAVTLVKKNGTGIELTEVGGSEFRKDSEAFLALMAAMKAKYPLGRSQPRINALALGGSHGPSASLLPAAMTRFREKYPVVDLALYSGSSREIEDLLLSGKIDIAVVTNPTSSGALNREPLRREPLAVFVAVGHPLAKTKRAGVNELARFPLIVNINRKGESRVAERLRDLGQPNFTAKSLLHCESAEAIKTMVRSGAGVGFLYRDSIKEEVRRKEFVVLNTPGIDLDGWSYILYRKDEKVLTPPSEQFLGLLRETANYD
jgi:DNA-binding transcriptional LysR family regulator